MLYFTVRQGGFWNVWGVRFDSTHGAPIGPAFQITHLDNVRRMISPIRVISDIGVSADRLVVTVMEQTGSVWLLDDTSP